MNCLKKVINTTKSGKPLDQVELPQEVKKLIGQIVGGKKWKEYYFFYWLF